MFEGPFQSLWRGLTIIVWYAPPPSIPKSNPPRDALRAGTPAMTQPIMLAITQPITLAITQPITLAITLRQIPTA